MYLVCGFKGTGPGARDLGRGGQAGLRGGLHLRAGQGLGHQVFSLGRRFFVRNRAQGAVPCFAAAELVVCLFFSWFNHANWFDPPPQKTTNKETPKKDTQMKYRMRHRSGFFARNLMDLIGLSLVPINHPSSISSTAAPGS